MNMTPIRSLFIILLLAFCSPALADKTDVVVLVNGDKVTGEIKGLLRGRLEFSTVSMGTVYIDWQDIRTVISETGQSVELANGQRFFGPLRKTEDSQMVAIETGPGLIGVDADDVIGMYPVEAGLWQRLDVQVSLGFSWDKASEVGKYNIGLDTEFRHPDHLTRASLSSEITTQKERDNTQRANASINHMRFRPNKRFTSYFGNIERNDELGIRLRTLAGVGYGWMPIRSNNNMLLFVLGADVNHEVPTDGREETNLEAVATVSYEYFRYSDPERTFSTGLTVFPSVTDWGRWRADFSMDFDMEFKRDLSWIVSFYANYDSDPISEEASSSDYGVRSSLAYKW
jgi:hypothetical protein